MSTSENAAAIIQTDCLLNIIIENAQDNQDILLPTLQFVEVCLSECRDLNSQNIQSLFYVILGSSRQSKCPYSEQYAISISWDAWVLWRKCYFGHSNLVRWGRWTRKATIKCIRSNQIDHFEAKQYPESYKQVSNPSSHRTRKPEKYNLIFIWIFKYFSFLLLLPRQIISDSIGTCYEEYVQDANRHYKVKSNIQIQIKYSKLSELCFDFRIG